MTHGPNNRIAMLTERSAPEAEKGFDRLLRKRLEQDGPEAIQAMAQAGTGFPLCYSPVPKDECVYVGGDVQPDGSVV